MVETLDLLLIQEAKYVLLQLPAALARNDLDEAHTFVDRLVNYRPQSSIDVTPAVVDLVQIKLQLHRLVSTPTSAITSGPNALSLGAVLPRQLVERGRGPSCQGPVDTLA